jgi:tetratricopeptide (TPR) repeat protein
VSRLVYILLLATLTTFAVAGAGAPGLRANEDDGATAEVRRQLTKKWGNLGPVYDLAVRFAGNGGYREAIVLLNALKRDDDPRVLNYLGYATRKSGDAERAIGFYEKALSLEPDFTQARQYLGEAWLQLGQPDKAKEQLAAIEARCGKECRDYRDLEQAIIAFTTGEPADRAGW